MTSRHCIPQPAIRAATNPEQGRKADVTTLTKGAYHLFELISRLFHNVKQKALSRGIVNKQTNKQTKGVYHLFQLISRLFHNVKQKALSRGVVNKQTNKQTNKRSISSI